MLIEKFLTRLFKVGNLTVVLPDGTTKTYGDGSGEPVRVRLTKAGMRRIGVNPKLGVGEAYMDGDLVIEEGDIWGLLETAGRNYRFRGKPKRGPLKKGVRKLRKMKQQWNDRVASRRNVAHHYDLSGELYRRFLDADMQYSCAYFSRSGMTLEEAQHAKKMHIAAKLALRPGMRVLDIGCGWGGMGLTLAGDYGANVTGVTLSTEQLAVAQERAKAAGLEDQAQFSLTDYRDVEGPFDRIVSVGMLEHVGAPNLRAYFQRVADLLPDNGVALIHSIGRRGGPALTNAFTNKYIFPGGYIPALSEVTTAIEEAGLWITDIEVLRLHYAETLRCWRERFEANRAEVAQIYDERFCRMWEFYLAGAELSFRYGGHMIMQLQLAKTVDSLPITRDYMVDVERAVQGRP